MAVNIFRSKKSYKENVKETSRNINIMGNGKVIRLTNLGANDIFVNFGNKDIYSTEKDIVLKTGQPSELFVIPDAASHISFICMEAGSSVSSVESISSESSYSDSESVSSASSESMSASSESSESSLSGNSESSVSVSSESSESSESSVSSESSDASPSSDSSESSNSSSSYFSDEATSIISIQVGDLF